MLCQWFLTQHAQLAALFACHRNCHHLAVRQLQVENRIGRCTTAYPHTFPPAPGLLAAWPALPLQPGQWLPQAACVPQRWAAGGARRGKECGPADQGSMPELMPQ